MKIYVRIPRQFLSVPDAPAVQEKIRYSFARELKKYYKVFTRFEVLFSDGNADAVDVFVMGNARRSSSETAEKIMSILRNIIHSAYGFDVKTNICLNWQGMPVNLQPDSPALPPSRSSEDLKEFDYEYLAQHYKAEAPRYTFSRVVLPGSVMTQIRNALAVIKVEAKVFDEWGLRNIIPFATCALSFYGPPGTGKSMAAEAIADELGKKIIRASYADIVSKYKGQGQKMAKALFLAAEKQDALLFIDEAESLLAKRASSSDGSTEASNAILINIKFVLPDADARREIWEQHIRGEGIHIPLFDAEDYTASKKTSPRLSEGIKQAILEKLTPAS